MDPALGLIVLLFATSTSSSQVSLTCVDTVKQSLKPLVNCTVSEDKIVCGDPDFCCALRNVTSFIILEKVNSTRTILRFCVGLEYLQREGSLNGRSCRFNQRVGFNSTFAVGVVTVDRKCWETRRSSLCLRDVTMLEEVLELSVIKYLPITVQFWNFDSTLYKTKMGWFQSLFVGATGLHTCDIYSEWITNLSNTSIRELSVVNAKCPEGSDGFLLKDMPFLQKLRFSSCCIKEFHNESFTGTPKLEDVTFVYCQLKSMPNILLRLPKLKYLDVSHNSEYLTFIKVKNLPPFHNLVSLTMSYNAIGDVLDDFPVLPEMKELILWSCEITSLERDAFRNISLLETLDLSQNDISSVHAEAFLSLRNLKNLDLRRNGLVTWPIIYFCSLLNLDLSVNKLTGLINLSDFSTTIDHLHLSQNNISGWKDMDIFSYKSNDLGRGSMFVPDGSVEEDNLTSMSSVTSNTRTYRIRESEKKPLNTLSGKKWVKMLHISSNSITRFTDIMLKSMDGIESVNLGDNPFVCSDCTIPLFQKWIKTTQTKIIDLPRIRCAGPYFDKDKPITELNFDLEPCLVYGPNYWIVAGIPIGIACSVFTAFISVYIRFRSQIVYMMHLYRIRREKSAAKSNCQFDAFVCYSGRDRRFVIKVLAPFLENSPERYKLCLHERDFVLGSHIVDNIVGAIEHSRKTILILSPHFIESKWCNWELEMANHKMFEDDKQFLIIIQVSHIARDIISRHLKFYMDTRTYLNWSQQASESAMKDMCRQLKNSLGESIFQSSSEQAPLLAGTLEI